MEIVSLCVASFSVGFSLCNVIWMFFSPKSKRNNRNGEAPNTYKQGKDSHDF